MRSAASDPARLDSLIALDATAALDAYAARDALAALAEADPSLFASPGRSETAEGIRRAEVAADAKGTVAVGRFAVDLDEGTYSLGHMYGEPGGGWFEDWEWTGRFALGPDGTWRAERPELLKEWGE